MSDQSPAAELTAAWCPTYCLAAPRLIL